MKAAASKVAETRSGAWMGRDTGEVQRVGDEDWVQLSALRKH